MAQHKKNEQWRGLLIFLLLLLFLAKDKIMQMIGSCTCEDQPGNNSNPPEAQVPGTIFLPSTGLKGSVETASMDVEEFERAEDQNVLDFSSQKMFEYAYDPTSDLLSIKKNTI